MNRRPLQLARSKLLRTQRGLEVNRFRAFLKISMSIVLCLN